MMEAKDTVMKPEERSVYLELSFGRYQIDITSNLQAQAEISFQAGEKAGLVASKIMDGAIARGAKQAGIREVVEWIKEQQYECKNPEDMAYHWLLIPPEDWQAFLKERGIK